MATMEYVSRAEFDAENGEFIFTGGRYLYKNSGQWLPDKSFAGGKGIGPLIGDARIILQVEFLRALLADRLSKYNRVKSNVATQNKNCSLGVGPSSDERYFGWFDFLDKLAEEIVQIQKELKKLIPKLPTNIRQAEYNAKRNAEREEADASMAQLARLLRF